MARRHGVTVAGEDQTLQQGGGPTRAIDIGALGHILARQGRLNLIPECLLDDRLVLAGIVLALVRRDADHHRTLPLRTCITNDTLPFMDPVLDVRFFRTDAGAEPVRKWLRDLPAVDRKTIGEDIKTVQFGWPLGMPLVDHLGGEIWEVRIKLGNRIARVLFATEGQTMVLLHGFIKKQQKTPEPDLDLAKDRLKLLKGR